MLSMDAAAGDHRRCSMFDLGLGDSLRRADLERPVLDLHHSWPVSGIHLEHYSWDTTCKKRLSAEGSQRRCVSHGRH